MNQNENNQILNKSPINNSTDLLMDNLQTFINAQNARKAKLELINSTTKNISDSIDLNIIKNYESKKSAIPFMLQSDTKFSSLKSTFLMNHLISCFVVGGECRLVFEQVLAFVLNQITRRQIDEAMQILHITNMQATIEQLEILKKSNAIPLNTPKCDLITKSNAERLVSMFINNQPYLIDNEIKHTLNGIEVEHDCFGGCLGILYSTLAPEPCIECRECKQTYNPEDFVKHSHLNTNTDLKLGRLQHWGFDSSNWHYYLRLMDQIDESRRLQIESTFDIFIHNYKQYISNLNN